jgi:aspartate/methionine/tyrosine aminotransferase
MQYAAAAAWSDERHVEEARAKYDENYKIAKEILGTEIPDSTFYIWLNVKNGVRFAAELYKEENLLVLPGEFLARDFATEYVRIALVESPDRTREGLLRLKNFMDKGVI